MVDTKNVSDADLKAIEAEVSKKQAEALRETAEKTAKEVEDKVRKEMESKIETDKLREQIQKQQEELTKTKAETEAQLKASTEVFEKRLQELEAQRKGVVTNQSPFEKPNPNVRTINGQEVDTEKLDLSEVEKLSAEAFKQKYRLPDFYFEKTGQTRR